MICRKLFHHQDTIYNIYCEIIKSKDYQILNKNQRVEQLFLLFYAVFHF